MTTQELLDAAAWIFANRPDVWDKVAGGEHPAPKGQPPMRLDGTLIASERLIHRPFSSQELSEQLNYARDSMKDPLGGALIGSLSRDGRPYLVQLAEQIDTYHPYDHQRTLRLSVEYKEFHPRYNHVYRLDTNFHGPIPSAP